MRKWPVSVLVMAIVGIIAGAATVAAAPAPEHGDVHVFGDAPGTRPRHGTDNGAVPAVTEVIHVTVVGTALHLASNATPTVEVHAARRLSSTWTGALPPVRIVDGRGTLSGWRVEWDLVTPKGAAAIAAADVTVRPTMPEVVQGAADGLVRGRSATAGGSQRVLFGACAGAGGGTYEAGAAVAAARAHGAGTSSSVALVLRVVPSPPPGC